MIQLRALASRWLEEGLEAEELHELEATLSENGEARRTFLAYMSIHAELSNISAGKEWVSELTRSAPPQPAGAAVSTSAAPYLLRNAFGLAIAASLMLIALGVWRGSDWDRDAAQDRQIAANVAQGPAMLSGIQPLSENCRWYVEEANRGQPESIQPGDVIRVTSGRLSLEYSHGTKVVLHSPAAYQLLSDMKAKMIVGRLKATVSEGGKGFSVATPRATVVDLGTEFGVEVSDDGATDVLVFQGEVDVDLHGDLAGVSPAQRLHMGEGVRLDARGTKSRIVSIKESSYSEQGEMDHDLPLVIAEVRDNILRNSLFSFYEIVATGLGEDSLAYVDRIAHEYNGVTAAGMPEYLIGAEYVKMFNSDKLNPSISIDVKLSTPAKLYVFLDDRLEPPSWLVEGFRDTGDDIGIDAGPYQSVGPEWFNTGPTGVGPGESVENQLSVWVREIPGPGVFRLGPAVESEGSTGDSNMYGIAATPLVRKK
ncbi:FecR family protein [Pirellulimonas nuda]|nr:FecR family protein [Pirellulimonas nuda]